MGYSGRVTAAHGVDALGADVVEEHICLAR